MSNKLGTESVPNAAFATLAMYLEGIWPAGKMPDLIKQLLYEAQIENEWLEALIEAQAEELRVDKPALPILTDNEAAPQDLPSPGQRIESQVFSSKAVSRFMKGFKRGYRKGSDARDRLSRIFPGLGGE